MAKCVTAIPATLTKFSSKPIEKDAKRRVAGYARVSTDNDEQFTSYEAQVDYYTNYIKSHDGWEFVDVYTDEGISGTHTAKRTGFQNMIKDALAGKIDLILTKSVSRFARNTVDSLTTIRNLKAKGIEVYFEKENIWTFDSKGEVLLTIMSSLAQEESRSISENILWGMRKCYEDGKVSVAYSTFLGYDKGEDGNLAVNPAQAETVKFIYSRFLEGKTPYTIAQELMERGDKTGTGNEHWDSEAVIRIHTNEKYAGNAILQKTYKTDLLAKRKINKGEVQKYFVRENHKAIISQEEYDITQLELEERKATLRQHSAKSVFSGKIICGDCGQAYGSKLWHSTDKYRRTIWQCNAKFHNEQKCTTPHLTEDEIKEVFVKALNKLITDKDSVITDLKEIRTMLLDTSELEKQLSETLIELEYAQGLVKSYFDGKPITDEDVSSGKFESYQRKYTQAKEKADSLSDQITDRKSRSRKMQRFINKVEQLNEPFSEFSEQMFTGLADHITVYSKEKIEVVFKSGQTISITE